MTASSNLGTCPPLADLLPHAPAMIFLERIVEYGPESIVCEVIPGTRDADYAEHGMLPTAMGVEYMAQTVAAYAGLHSETEARGRVGYVIAVRALTLTVPHFEPGQVLAVHAHRQWGEDRIARFKTSIECEGQQLAAAFLSVYRPDPDEMS